MGSLSVLHIFTLPVRAIVGVGYKVVGYFRTAIYAIINAYVLFPNFSPFKRKEDCHTMSQTSQDLSPTHSMNAGGGGVRGRFDRIDKAIDGAAPTPTERIHEQIVHMH